MSGQDQTTRLQAQLKSCISQNTPVRVIGGGSKGFFGRSTSEDLEPMNVGGHAGVINYEPTELVVTARAGTTIRELNQVLAEKGQCLPFDPPELNGMATLGGTLACGLSGPARPYAGSARDFVLGTHILNGKGEYLRLGGEVMKNVAGYDVSRLMVGSMGTLGVILQASLKVLPEAQRETTLVFHFERDSALDFMNELAGRPLPVSASLFYGDILFVRLSGTDAGVDSAYRTLGGERLPSTDEIWRSLRELEHPFFQTELPLWRISLPALAKPELPGEVLIDWGGAQWWLRCDADVKTVRQAVSQCGGHATLFRGGDRGGEVFHPLSPGMRAMQERIRASFDPGNILNPGRLLPPQLAT
jgi:glycolate oxidase FAD binding subunit